MNLDIGNGRMRRRAALLALPLVGGALALAPSAALASGPDYQTCASTNSATFVTCMAEVNSAGGNWEITLAKGSTQPPQPVTVDAGVNLEITGASPAYTYAPTTLNQAPDFTGQQIPTGLPDEDFITVEPGANLLVKGIDITSAGRSGFAAFDVHGDAEFDNDLFLQDQGYDVESIGTSSQVPNVVINDSTLEGSTTGAGVLTDDTSTATLNDDTIVGKANGGVEGNAILNDDLFYFNGNANAGTSSCEPNNDGSDNITATDVIEDDGSCAAEAGSGVTDYTDSQIGLKGQGFNGGPVETAAIPTTSVAVGAGTGCLPTDGRFFVRPSTSVCDVGSYQTGATSDTTAPVCTEASQIINYNAPGGATDTVPVSDAGAGLGPDSVTTYSLTLNPSAPNGTSPGSVSWNIEGLATPNDPFTGSTWWDATTSTSTDEGDLDTTAPFDVTAQKQSTDVTAGDTTWSFTATDWAGQTTLCS